MILDTLKSIFNKKKINLSRSEIEQQERLQVANDFVNVRDIRGNFLYSKDGFVFSYLKIEPLSLDLLSHAEKMKKVKLFAAEFSSERKNYKFFSISRPVDISHVTANLSNALTSADDAVQKDLLKQEIRAVSNFALTGEVIQRQFFMIIWEPYKQDAESELMKRASDLQQKFTNCEMRTEIAEQSAIIRLCNLFANPSYATIEDGEFDNSIPFLAVERGVSS